MNPHELDILHETTMLRTNMMETLTDADLAFSFTNNAPLGELCRMMGDVQRAYIDSFKTRKMSWDVRNTEPGLATSVEKLKAWYKELDEELVAVLNAIPDADFQTSMIDRGWSIPLGAQFHVYREALLIFCGKCSIYLQALNKPFTDQWKGWIG